MTGSENIFKRFSREIVAVAAGALLMMAFPKWNVAGFAWVAPGMILFVGVGGTTRQAFGRGFLFGLVFAAGTVYWLQYMPVTGLPILAWWSLAAYLAVYYALWVWFCRRALPGTLEEMLHASWAQRTWWILAAAGMWVLLEWVAGWMLTGFPWLKIGVTQHRMVPLIQFASVAGAPGLSFVVVWFSVSLMFALFALATQPRQRFPAWREICLPMLAVAVLFAWGNARIKRHDQSSSREIKVALVQPSFPQTLLWNQEETTNRFNRMIELSEEALASKPDLLIWPEAAMPGFIRHQEETFSRVSSLSAKHETPLICGGDDARMPPDDPKREQPQFFNSVYLLDETGMIPAQYDKRQLVAFGEYTPLVKWLPFMKYLTPVGEGFSPGEKAIQLPLEKLDLKVSPLICFEDAFAWLARDAVTPETDVLVNLTNDGWFSESAAQWQHLANALFRAVETGRPLIRCANNGITCWVDPVGRVYGTAFPDGRSVYAEGIKQFEVAIANEPTTTLYWRRGNWFILICALLALRPIVGIWRSRLKSAVLVES